MDCLTACENSVLTFYLEKGEAAVPIYRCAEELSRKDEDNTAGECVEACGHLIQLGLLAECGKDSNIYKCSAGAMGDIEKGYFSEIGNTSEALLKVQKELLELRQAHDRAVAIAERARAGGKGKGGRADPPE